MKAREVVKRVGINHHPIRVEQWVMEDGKEEDLEDFFEHFHERYRVVEHRQDMNRTGKVKQNVREGSKTNSQCSTKRTTFRTSKSSDLKARKPNTRTEASFLLEDKLNPDRKKKFKTKRA
jgi:hypothetical protein